MSEEQQLKFIASLFRMAMQEFNNVMGPESIQTIFRLIGENQGAAIVKRLQNKFKVKDWTPAEFADKFTKDMLDPALGKGQSEINVSGDELTIVLKASPFKRAGIDIANNEGIRLLDMQ